MENAFSQNLTDELTACKACPLECGANRLTGVGRCGSVGLKIAKYYLHPFEEPCISFKNGSGTIFFCGCNLQCVFCQNYEVSRAQRGKEITPKDLADIFKELENAGADNISLVTPTHVAPYLIEAFEIYKPNVPVVYNSGGYEKIQTLERLDKYIDIYLPDLKFYSPVLSKRYTGKEDYFERASEAISFMSNKPTAFTPDGKMLSGLIVRHLVMPLCSGDSIALLKWFQKTLPKTAYLSLMSQYTPFGETEKYPELARSVTKREYQKVLDFANEIGIENIFVQQRTSSDERYIPSWDF
ncbi:MAG: radical SAM protein [Clostridia bacterium]|nr:radical SAM protein [Clostridia bacterium]